MTKTKYLLSWALALLALPLAAQQPVVQLASGLRADEDPEAQEITIVDEDFSGMTKGTNDAYDPTPILDNQGWPLDPTQWKPYDKECTKPWGGDKNMAFSAGGALALPNGGFINTPTGNYSGTLTMTFRAKILPGEEPLVPKIEVLLCRRSQLVDFKRVEYTVTSEWQEFKFEAINGWWQDCMIQFFNPGNDWGILLDDVKITHVITSNEPPRVWQAESITNDGFTATWVPVSTADEYLLSVYEKLPNPDIWSNQESFDNINITDGKWINTSNPGYPEGWSFNLADGGFAHLYTEEGYYQNGTQAICFDSKVDQVLTPVSPYPITEFAFWIRADVRRSEDITSGTMLKVDALTQKGWVEWVSVPLRTLQQEFPDGLMLDLTNNLKVLTEPTQFKFYYDVAEGDQTTVAVDNVSLKAPGTPIRKYFWEDHVVPGGGTADTCRVEGEGFDQDADYFYVVQSRNEKFTSIESEEMEVWGVHVPTALPATDVTDNSYVAHWECGKKADFFRVDQLRLHKAEVDEPAYVILEEDFSKVSSSATPQDPEKFEPTTSFIPVDQYTKLGGWMASSYCIANGMLGGQKQEPFAIAGSVRTPTIDLSNNSGVFQVDFRVYGEAEAIIMVVGANALQTVGMFQLPSTGFHEGHLWFRGGMEYDYLTFYVGDYGTPFLLDWVKVTQDLHTGDELVIVSKTETIYDPTARQVAMKDVDFGDQNEILYQVTATRYYHGNEKDMYPGYPSNRIPVQKDNATELIPLHTPVVAGGDGEVVVVLREQMPVKIFSVNGSVVANYSAQPGRNVTELPAGLYIVNAGGYTAKVIVR